MFRAVCMGGVVSKAFSLQTPIKFISVAAFLYPHVWSVKHGGIHGSVLMKQKVSDTADGLFSF